MAARKRRILYIEDHEDTRDLVVLVLQERNFDVKTGESSCPPLLPTEPKKCTAPI